MELNLRDLRESNVFLNALIDNITSAIFVVDKEVRIQQFNSSFEALFAKHEQDVLGELCGNALGCAFAVEEQQLCGQASHCAQCVLRESILRAMTKKVPSYKQTLTRKFYIRSRPLLKYFQFSTRYVTYDGEEMILIIVDDITDLETQKLELMEKQAYIEQDLEAAAGIQASLLPKKVPHAENLDVSWKFTPCDQIGGDIFGVFPLEENRVGGYMLDVSGHGVPSALVTVSVSQMLQSAFHLNSHASPAALCRMLDREYPIERFDKFFTIACMVVDCSKGELVYCSAGHPPLLLLHRDGELEVLEKGGPIIGLGGLLPFEEERRELRAGDKIVLYTDGVVDCRNAESELFGEERLHSLLRRLGAKSIDACMEEAYRSIMDFAHGVKLPDDISLLGMEFKG